MVFQKMTPEEEIRRTKIPEQGDLLGVVLCMLGAGKLRVECEDGHERICRIPGKIKKRVWVKEGDLVIVKPWVVQTDERGDIMWRYTRTQANYLKKKGFIKNLNF